ncbi:unnamed protein product [Cylicocyclus nassatus]|uniref:L-Fucosyltransferase n=1 Tax=Cylicocyclus nassatus TaxID=53992 RepID=A0AA36GKC9_CYLNA|nr:unnamed protein product [Cylicocyclus nassatus]
MHKVLWRRVATLLIFSVCLLVWRNYDRNSLSSHTNPKKFVGFHTSHGRLGNQLFHMMTGYGIARTLNRTHYIPYEIHRNHVMEYLCQMEKVFPRLKETYILAERETKQTIVPFSYWCCNYIDPSMYSGNTNQFLLLDFKYGQNPKYFADYIVDVRAILQFSKEAEKNGSDILLLLQNYSDSMCVHTRMTDFVIRNASTKMNETVKAANSIAKKKNLSHFLIFGDDMNFMVKLSKTLAKDSGWRKNAKAICYGEYMDLYIASQLCASFLVSAPRSTFGWWLAFFVQDQKAVYYLDDTRRSVLKMPIKEHFLKSWQLYIV